MSPLGGRCRNRTGRTAMTKPRGIARLVIFKSNHFVIVVGARRLARVANRMKLRNCVDQTKTRPTIRRYQMAPATQSAQAAGD